MMLFVFLQLRPELLDNLLLEAALLTVCCAVLTVSLIIAGLVVHKDDADRARLHEMVTRLADKLDHMADTGITVHTRQELLRLRTEYAKLAYQVREDANAQASVSNLFDMFRHARPAHGVPSSAGSNGTRARAARMHRTCASSPA